MPVALIRSTFVDCLTELEEDFWQLRFENETTDLFLQPLQSDASLIHSLSIDRPCRNARLAEGIWSLLGSPGTVFYFPDCPSPLVRERSAGEAMPSSLRNALGEPVVVSSSLEILQVIERT